MATQVEPEVLATDDTNAPVESVAPETPVTDETSPAPETSVTTDRPRGPDGKFIPKQPADSGDAATDTGEAAPIEGAAAVATEAAEAPVTPQADTTNETPWSLKVDHETFGLEGAVVIPGKGILFPEQHAELIHKLLGRGIQYGTERPRWKQEAQKEREANAIEKAQLSVIGEVAQRIFAARDVDELAAVAMDLWSDREKLQWEAQKRRDQAEIAAQRKALAPSPEQQQHETETKLGESIQAAIAEAKVRPWGAGLQDKDWQALSKLVGPIARSFIVQVPEDVPQFGLRQGDLAFDADRFFGFLEQQAGLLTTERSRFAEEKKKQAETARAKTANATALVSSVKAPPSVASTEKPAPAGSGSGPVFTSREEYDRFIRTGQ